MRLVATVLALYAVAKAEICESNRVGIVGDKKFSNIDELKQFDYEQFSLNAMSHCTDFSGNLIGAKYSVKDDNGKVLYLKPLGEMTGECQTIHLDAPLDSVRASY